MMDGNLAKGQWWFLFNGVPNLPEALIAAGEEIWLRHFFDRDRTTATDDTRRHRAEYVRVYQQPEAVMGGWHRPHEEHPDEVNAHLLTSLPTDFLADL